VGDHSPGALNELLCCQSIGLRNRFVLCYAFVLILESVLSYGHTWFSTDDRSLVRVDFLL